MNPGVSIWCGYHLQISTKSTSGYEFVWILKDESFLGIDAVYGLVIARYAGRSKQSFSTFELALKYLEDRGITNV